MPLFQYTVSAEQQVNSSLVKLLVICVPRGKDNEYNGLFNDTT